MSEGAKAMATNLLQQFNVSSRYERRARLLPGLLTMMALVPLGIAFGAPVTDWLRLIATGAGLWAVCGVLLSHLASGAGNRYQTQLWPRWPHDSPTNRWLHPEERLASSQQKRQVYAAVKRLSGLDIEAATQDGMEETEAIVNDSVARLRNRLWRNSLADRLDLHLAEYGFSRNFAGLMPIWISLLVLSAAGCWIGYWRCGTDLLWCSVSSILLACGIVAALNLEHHVRVRAQHYTESFFATVLKLDEAERGLSSAPARTRKTKQQADLDGTVDQPGPISPKLAE